jgi:hypothetical protein
MKAGELAGAAKDGLRKHGEMNRRTPLVFFSICAVVDLVFGFSEVAFGCRRNWCHSLRLTVLITVPFILLAIRLKAPVPRTVSVNYEQLEAELHAIDNGLMKTYEVSIENPKRLDDGK